MGAVIGRVLSDPRLPVDAAQASAIVVDAIRSLAFDDGRPTPSLVTGQIDRNVTAGRLRSATVASCVGL